MRFALVLTTCILALAIAVPSAHAADCPPALRLNPEIVHQPGHNAVNATAPAFNDDYEQAYWELTHLRETCSGALEGL